MASAGKSAKLYVNGHNLTSYMKEGTSVLMIGAEETTTWGNDDKAFIPGLEDGNFNGGGLFDGSADAIDEVLEAAIGGSGDIVAHIPLGDSIGNPAYCMQSLQSSYSVTSPLSVVSVSMAFQAQSGISRALVLAPLATYSDTNQTTTYDGGAATANGGVAFLQFTNFPAESGTPSVTVTILDSADGVSWATLTSFTAISGAGAEFQGQRKAITGTVRRYLAALIDTNAVGTTARVFVAFERNPTIV